MTNFHLAAYAFFVLQAIAWVGSGVLIGTSHFVVLRWNVRMLALGRAPLVIMALQVARLSLLAGLLATIARNFGGLPLVLAAAGVLAARNVVVRLGAPM